jgi:orotate phosphoribosyltransferase
MNDLILHISDLHVSDQSGDLGPANSNTHLTLDQANNTAYIKLFTDKVKELEYNKLYLLVTGDISNIAESVEFEEATHLLELLMAELRLPKEQILLIPGDHDVHRDTIKDAIRKKIAKEQHQILKFKNFNECYHKIKGKDFDYKKSIFDHLIIGDILLLAVNSNFNVDQNGGHGFLPSVEFEKELAKFREEYINHELILCLHHNLEGDHEDKQFGQWQEHNRRLLSTILERNRVKCVLNGNEHTANSKTLADSEGVILSDSGPFSSKGNPRATFKVYEIETSGGNLILQNKVYELRTISSTREGAFGAWAKYSYEDIKKVELENFVLRKAPERQENDQIDFLPENNDQPEILSAEQFPVLPTEKDRDHAGEPAVSQELEEEEKKTEIRIYENKVLQKNLYEIVKEKKLFHQGHFHWSETSRAHNWIDIGRLLENFEDLYFAQNTIIDVLEKMELVDQADLIIGLGYEGNMIASKASLKYPQKYTYLPYSYRWLDHNKFENKLNLKNEEKKYKTVILITDVVNDGRTIRKLVGKEDREKTFFDNVEKIIVVSLFYTGDQKLNHDILNYDRLPKEYQKNDEVINNIEFYSVRQLKIEKCPYGDDYKTECFILRDNLHCVHKFYTEQ